MDEPFSLAVGTPVSAKYRGAFCEATIEKVDKLLICRIQYKETKTLASVQFQDILPSNSDFSPDSIPNKYQINDEVLVKSQNGAYCPAIIHKITDHSSYYVVFDDGDKRTLKRTQLVLKGDRHFKESESLDRLPLTNPEQFKNPVMYSCRRKTRCNDGDIESCEESDSQEEDTQVDSLSKKSSLSSRQSKLKSNDLKKTQAHSKTSSALSEYPNRNVSMIGQLVLINSSNSNLNDKKRTFPALIVSASASWDTPLKHSQLLVKSFKDNKFYAVNKRDFGTLSRDHAIKLAQSNKPLRSCIEKAVLWLDNRELPASWDRENLLGESSNNTSSESNYKSRDLNHKKLHSKGNKDGEEVEEDSSDEDVDLEAKDHWLAMLYEFMEDSGCPMNKAPSLANKDLDLYKLHKLVKKFGGYSRVTSQLKWPLVYSKMNLPSAPAAARHIQSAYKKYLLPFDEMNRKLGSSFHLQLFTSRRGSHSARERRNSGIMQHHNQQSQLKITSPPATTVVPPSAVPTTNRDVIVPSADKKAPSELKAAKIRSKQPPTLIKEAYEHTNTNENSTKESDTSGSEKTKESRKRKATSELMQLPINEKDCSSEEAPTRLSRRKRPCNEEDTVSVSSVSSSSAATSATHHKKRSLKSIDSGHDIWEDGLPIVGCRVGVKYGINGNAMYEAKVVQIIEKKSHDSLTELELDEQMVVVHYVGWHSRHDETVPLNRIVHLQGDMTGMVNLTKPSLVAVSGKPLNATTVVKLQSTESCEDSPIEVKQDIPDEKAHNQEVQDISNNKNKPNVDEVSSTASSCTTSTKTFRTAMRLRRDVTNNQIENDIDSVRQDDVTEPVAAETVEELVSVDQEEIALEKEKNEAKPSTRRGTRSQQSDSEPVRSPVKLRTAQKRKCPTKPNSQNSTEQDSGEKKNSLSSSEEEETQPQPPAAAEAAEDPPAAAELPAVVDVKKNRFNATSTKRQKRSCVMKKETTESSQSCDNFSSQAEEKLPQIINTQLLSKEVEEKSILELSLSPPIIEGPVTDISPNNEYRGTVGPITRNKRVLSPTVNRLETPPIKEECDRMKGHSTMSNSDCESTCTSSTVHMIGQDMKLEHEDLETEQEKAVPMPSPPITTVTATTTTTATTAPSPPNNSSSHQTARGSRRGRSSRGCWRKRNVSQTDSSRTYETPHRQGSEDLDTCNEASDVASSRPSHSSKKTRRQAWTPTTSTPRNNCHSHSHNSSSTHHPNNTWLDTQNLSVLASSSPNIVPAGGCRDGNESPLCFSSPSIERNNFVRTSDRPFVRLHPNFYPPNLESLSNTEERVVALEVALRKVNEAWRKTKQDLRDVERRRLKKRARLRAMGGSSASGGALFGGASSSSCVNSASPGSAEPDSAAAMKAEVVLKEFVPNDSDHPVLS